MESKEPGDKDQKTNQDIPEATNELNELIKKNEDLLKFQKKCEEDIANLKKENESRKEIINNKNNAELFNLIIDELKDYLESQNRTNEIIEQKQKLQHDIDNAYYKAQQASANYDELEAYNADIIKKIKEINEEKNKIEDKLKENYNNTKIECDKFKEEYQKKYDEISNDVIIKENEDLKNRIKECQENTNKIKENINEQMEMRKKQNDSITSMLNGQINDKLSEIDKETNKFEVENEKLKAEIANERAKFGDDTDLTKEYNKKFEKAKKEYEKIFKDLIQLKQENLKLRELDPLSIKDHIEKSKQALDELVKNNKDLQAKIKELKNKKSNDAATPTKKIEDDKKAEDDKEEDEKEEKK